MKAAIFDMDGTLSDPSHRLHHLDGEKDWKAFHDGMIDDAPNEGVVELAALPEDLRRLVGLQRLRQPAGVAPGGGLGGRRRGSFGFTHLRQVRHLLRVGLGRLRRLRRGEGGREEGGDPVRRGGRSRVRGRGSGGAAAPQGQRGDEHEEVAAEGGA